MCLLTMCLLLTMFVIADYLFIVDDVFIVDGMCYFVDSANIFLLFVNSNQ